MCTCSLDLLKCAKDQFQNLGSNCFDGGIGPGRKGVTLPLTVIKHDDTLGSTGGTSFVDS